MVFLFVCLTSLVSDAGDSTTKVMDPGTHTPPAHLPNRITDARTNVCFFKTFLTICHYSWIVCLLCPLNNEGPKFALLRTQPTSVYRHLLGNIPLEATYMRLPQ